MKTQQKTVIILITATFLLSLLNTLNLPYHTKIIESLTDLENQIEKNLKHQGYWELSPIVIDDSGSGDYTWVEAVLQLWCNGFGTWNDPYIIENVTINGQGSNNCIEVKNSNVFFIIKNCTLYNSGVNLHDAGIYLYLTNNGQIINNNCSNNNEVGLYLRSSNNNTICGNKVSNNNENGIYLRDCSNNTICENIAKNNNQYGIFLERSNDNSIFGNNASSNHVNGIYLKESNNNTINVNTANNNNQSGIFLENSYNNTGSENIVNNNKDNGIQLLSSIKNTISGNTVENNVDNGIQLYDSINNSISENIINNNLYGIYLKYSLTNYIVGNTVNDNYYGIYLSSSNNITVSGNYMNECGLGIYGSFEELLSHNIDTTNLVNGKYIYYYRNEIGLGSNNFTDVGQIILINCNNSLISNLNVSHTSTGISLYYCKNNVISNINTSSNKDNGIFLKYSSNNNISDNIANCNKNNGLLIYSSNYNNISRNTAINNNFYGIELRYSNNNIIGENSVSENHQGIYLQHSNKSKIFRNLIFNNSVGINLKNSNYNEIIGNIINNHSIGIYLEKSDYNNISDNDLRYNENPYEELDCEGNLFENNKGVEELHGTEFPLVVVLIFMIPIIAIMFISGIVVIKKKYSKIKVARREITETERDMPLDIESKLPTETHLSSKIVHKEGLSSEELEELRKTEEEVAVEKEKHICMVHRGDILGTVYLCPNCESFYCLRCATMLKEKGEHCWVCKSKIEL